MIWLPQVNFSGVETYEVVSGDTFCGNYAVQIIYLLYMQIASIWIMGFNTQILGHILVIFSELASQKWSYFGHIFAKFGHILGVNLVIFWKNLAGNPE